MPGQFIFNPWWNLGEELARNQSCWRFSVRIALVPWIAMLSIKNEQQLGAYNGASSPMEAGGVR